MKPRQNEDRHYTFIVGTLHNELSGTVGVDDRERDNASRTEASGNGKPLALRLAIRTRSCKSLATSMPEVRTSNLTSTPVWDCGACPLSVDLEGGVRAMQSKLSVPPCRSMSRISTRSARQRTVPAPASSKNRMLCRVRTSMPLSLVSRRQCKMSLCSTCSSARSSGRFNKALHVAACPTTVSPGAIARGSLARPRRCGGDCPSTMRCAARTRPKGIAKVVASDCSANGSGPVRRSSVRVTHCAPHAVSRAIPPTPRISASGRPVVAATAWSSGGSSATTPLETASMLMPWLALVVSAAGSCCHDARRSSWSCCAQSFWSLRTNPYGSPKSTDDGSNLYACRSSARSYLCLISPTRPLYGSSTRWSVTSGSQNGTCSALITVEPSQRQTASSVDVSGCSAVCTVASGGAAAVSVVRGESCRLSLSFTGCRRSA
eukprot:5569447-Pleurochrysis_carterae.AAC.2